MDKTKGRRKDEVRKEGTKEERKAGERKKGRWNQETKKRRKGEMR